MDDFNADLGRALRYSTEDAAILRRQLATDPEHLKAGSIARGVAADAYEEAGDKDFADYLRSKFPLGVDGGKVKRSSLRLHRLLTTLMDRHPGRLQGDGHPASGPRLRDQLNEEAAKELERMGRHHEASILRSHNPVVYRNGVVEGNFDHFAWPGGNQLIYHTGDGGVLCPECRNGRNGSLAMETPQTDPQWQVHGVSTYDEGPPIHCDHCNKVLEATYGDPEAEGAE